MVTRWLRGLRGSSVQIMVTRWLRGSSVQIFNEEIKKYGKVRIETLIECDNWDHDTRLYRFLSQFEKWEEDKKKCSLCGHPLKDNMHGLDQDDFGYDEKTQTPVYL